MVTDMITDLIGRKFRRNKYGLSLWEDRISDIHYSLELVVPPTVKKHSITEHIQLLQKLGKKYGYKVKIKVTGENTFSTYDIDEIIVF